MSDEARRVFKMETILGLIAGKLSADTSDLLGYLTQRELCAEEKGAIAPFAKGWLYSQHAPFVDCAYSEGAVYEEWLKKEAARLGDNVSIEPIPADEMAGMAVILDKIAEFKATIAGQTEEISGLTEKVAELEPFQGQASDLEKKVADLEGKLETAQADLAGAKKEIAGFAGKIAIDENDIESSVKDMVSKAVKDALATLPAGAAVAAAGETDTAAAEEATAEEATDDVPDDFGFGASGANDDGFGF